MEKSSKGYSFSRYWEDLWARFSRIVNRWSTPRFESSSTDPFHWAKYSWLGCSIDQVEQEGREIWGTRLGDRGGPHCYTLVLRTETVPVKNGRYDDHKPPVYVSGFGIRLSKEVMMLRCALGAQMVCHITESFLDRAVKVFQPHCIFELFLH